MVAVAERREVTFHDDMVEDTGVGSEEVQKIVGYVLDNLDEWLEAEHEMWRSTKTGLPWYQMHEDQAVRLMGVIGGSQD